MIRFVMMRFFVFLSHMLQAALKKMEGKRAREIDMSVRVFVCVRPDLKKII